MIKSKSKRESLFIIINVLACVLIFALPLLLNPRNMHPLSWSGYIGFLVPVMVYVVVFYLNFLLFIPKLVAGKRIGVYIVVNVTVALVLACLLQIWHGYYFTNIMTDVPPRPYRGFVWQFVLRDFAVMMLVASLALGVRMTMAWTRAENEKVKMEAVASEAELKNLKSQLNPHFLFNTLNNIYSLMSVNPDAAKDSILELSKILRYVLCEDDEKAVPLSSELSFTKNYIELMKLRLTDKVKLSVDIRDTDSGLMIAPLVFISLVENAFKHGVSQDESSFIDISIGLEGNTVRCVVRNSLHPKSDGDRSGSGIGIENLKKRLSLIYPHGHIYSYGPEGGEYVADLSINLA